MASPRSRLVTWSQPHLSFLGRRFLRPHPDLDRSATPALPPGGGRPFTGGDSVCSPAFRRLRRGPQGCWPGGPSPGHHMLQARVERGAVATVAAATVGLPVPATSQIRLHRVQNGSLAPAFSRQIARLMPVFVKEALGRIPALTATVGLAGLMLRLGLRATSLTCAGRYRLTKLAAFGRLTSLAGIAGPVRPVRQVGPVRPARPGDG